MEHRRDADGLADIPQSRPGLFLHLRLHQALLSAGDGHAAGLHDQDVVRDQIGDQVQVQRVAADLRRVAPDHADDAADAPVHDVVVQRTIGRAEAPAEHVVDGLVAEPHHEVVGLVRNLHLAAIAKILDRNLDDFLGHVQGAVFLKLHVHGPGHVRLRRGGDDLGVVAAGDANNGLHDALDVHDHRLDGARGKRQFLLHRVAGDRHAVPHQGLVRRAAHARERDAALRAGPFGLLDQGGVLGREDNHLGKGRLVAVDDDVDGILAEDAEVRPRAARNGCAEENILKFGADHGSAPTVAEGTATCLGQDALVVLIHADVGAMEHLADLPVNRARRDAGLLPDLLPRLGGALEEPLLALALAEFGQRRVTDDLGDLLDRFSLGLDAIYLGNHAQLLHVSDAVVLGLAGGGCNQRLGHAAAVIAVGGRAGGDHSGKVARDNRARRRPANAPVLARNVLDDPARTHEAIAAAQSAAPELALGRHRLVPVPGSLDAITFRLLQHRLRGFIKCLNAFFGHSALLALLPAKRPEQALIDFPRLRNGARRALKRGLPLEVRPSEFRVIRDCAQERQIAEGIGEELPVLFRPDSVAHRERSPDADFVREPAHSKGGVNAAPAGLDDHEQRVYRCHGRPAEMLDTRFHIHDHRFIA